MNIKNWNQDDFIQEVLEESERLMSEPVKKKEKPKKDLNKILINYHILIESIVVWASHQDYNLLVQKFLNKEMNGFQFQEAFLKLWYSNTRQISELIQTIEDGDKKNQILDFSYTPKSTIFHGIINNIFFAAEGHESETNESKLRSFIQEYYFPTLRKHFDDSFFSPKIDLDQLIDRSYKILYSIAIVTTVFLLVNF